MDAFRVGRFIFGPGNFLCGVGGRTMMIPVYVACVRVACTSFVWQVSYRTHKSWQR
jgi:hypothetical protein